MGGAADMRRTADLLDKVRENIIDAYLRHSSAGRDQVGAWMSAETWFTGQEAVDAGLADSVTSPVKVTACADLSRFGYRRPPLPPAPSPEQIAAHARRLQVAARL
jgi:ATP-dependent Clp protease protease subunit